MRVRKRPGNLIEIRPKRSGTFHLALLRFSIVPFKLPCTSSKMHRISNTRLYDQRKGWGSKQRRICRRVLIKSQTTERRGRVNSPQTSVQTIQAPRKRLPSIAHQLKSDRHRLGLLTRYGLNVESVALTKCALIHEVNAGEVNSRMTTKLHPRKRSTTLVRKFLSSIVASAISHDTLLLNAPPSDARVKTLLTISTFGLWTSLLVYLLGGHSQLLSSLLPQCLDIFLLSRQSHFELSPIHQHVPLCTITRLHSPSLYHPFRPFWLDPNLSKRHYLLWYPTTHRASCRKRK